MHKPMTTLKRDSYGALDIPARPTRTDSVDTWRLHEVITRANSLISSAVKAKVVRAAYDDMRWERISSRRGSKRVGEAVHHDIYDVTPDGKYALLCVREVEGTAYGIATKSKEYFLLSRFRTTCKVSEVPKHLPAKAAKAAGTQLGFATVSVAMAMSLAPAIVEGIQKSSRARLPLTLDEAAAEQAERVQRRMNNLINETPHAVPGDSASAIRRTRAAL